MREKYDFRTHDERAVDTLKTTVYVIYIHGRIKQF
ncbi:hypothetical protein AQUSIP_10360 [Aquicella siphonis]|uniref:Uncharacterized protein n=1 Tax=Aquicella siphonis TaxID=254247 RepID=A0A5E4PH08_9COXI|nr:hypothetical protein AQUSIP_10360 [Aquicella siphonis]